MGICSYHQNKFHMDQRIKCEKQSHESLEEKKKGRIFLVIENKMACKQTKNTNKRKKTIHVMWQHFVPIRLAMIKKVW